MYVHMYEYNHVYITIIDARKGHCCYSTVCCSPLPLAQMCIHINVYIYLYINCTCTTYCVWSVISAFANLN